MPLDEMSINARKKSIGKSKEKVYRVKEKVLKRYIVIALAVIGLSVTANIVQLGSDVKDFVERKQVVSEVLDESRMAVSSATHRTQNNDGYYYDVFDIVDYIEKDPEKIPERLYGSLNAIGFGISYNEDEINSIISAIYRNEDGSKMYDNFEDFLTKNNFVDKNGEPSVEVYGKKICDYIYSKEQYNNQLEEIKGNNR